MGRVSFQRISPRDEADNFCKAILELIDKGTFDNEAQAARRLAVSVDEMKSWAMGQRVPPRIIRSACKRYGINPGFVHLGLGQPIVTPESIYRVVRALSL